MENIQEDAQRKEIITTLIKDHLINTQFINGLNALGWYSQDYQLHFSDIIFKLIGISDEKEELFEVYLEWCSKIAKTEILKDEDLLQKYVNEIYQVLLGEAEE
jgi:hypothetical protein